MKTTIKTGNDKFDNENRYNMGRQLALELLDEDKWS